MDFDLGKAVWIRQPKEFSITNDAVEIITEPHTDLWQNTFYHFCNDSAPVLQLRTDEEFFTFTVKTQFESKHRFDQCGIAIYLDSLNWLKASVEYETAEFQRLGSVVTNNGWSDWASTDIDASIKTMWYRLSRRADDFRVDVSEDGKAFRQIRICHLFAAAGEVPFGIYACSPENSSFRAIFSSMTMSDCLWEAHDGQAPDSE